MVYFRKFWTRFRIYTRFSKIRFIDRLSYRAHFFLVLTEYLLIIIVNYFLWKAILADGRTIRGYALEDMVTYVAIAGVFRFIVNELSGGISREMSGQYHSGELIMNLLKPVGYQLYIYFRAFGGILFQLLFRGATVLTIWALFVGLMPPDSTMPFIVSLALGVLIYAGIAFLVGLTAFHIENNAGVLFATTASIELLSGTLIPLVMFPSWVVSILDYLPFKMIFYIPMQIYLGRLGVEETVGALIVQTIWVSTLSIAGFCLFKASVRKLTIQGG